MIILNGFLNIFMILAEEYTFPLGMDIEMFSLKVTFIEFLSLLSEDCITHSC